jgi:hypothetical protein
MLRFADTAIAMRLITITRVLPMCLMSISGKSICSASAIELTETFVNSSAQIDLDTIPECTPMRNVMNRSPTFKLGLVERLKLRKLRPFAHAVAQKFFVLSYFIKLRQFMQEFHAAIT